MTEASRDPIEAIRAKWQQIYLFRHRLEEEAKKDIDTLLAALDQVRQQLAVEIGDARSTREASMRWQARAEAAEAKLAEVEAERNALRTCSMIVCPYEADLKALRTALSALETMAKNWRESAEALRAGKGQMTREKRGHEVLASCGAILGEIVATLLETGTEQP